MHLTPKKLVILCAFVVLVPAFAFSQNPVTLDTALKNSIPYLTGRLPANSKVVVLNFTSDWPRMSDYIIEELIGYIVNEGTLTVVDRNNLEIIRKEMDFQLSGEVSDETAQSIGKKLGAQNIISGGITALGSTYRLRIRAISVESAQIVGMHNVDVAQDSRSAALTGTAYAGSAAHGTNIFPSGFAGTWKRNNFNNTLTFTRNTVKDNNQDSAWKLIHISGNSYTVLYGNTTDWTTTITIRLNNGRLEISNDSGTGEDNWNGVWGKQ